VSAGEAGPFLEDLEAEGVVERLAEPGEAATAPSPGGAPSVVWREDLHHFGGCSFMPAQGAPCEQNPQNS
jgi:hypothetical protein